MHELDESKNGLTGFVRVHDVVVNQCLGFYGNREGQVFEVQGSCNSGVRFCMGDVGDLDGVATNQVAVV